MTQGHKHRQITLKRDSPILLALKEPLLHTTNLDWVDKSRLVFGPCKEPEHNSSDELCYTLSSLGILHGLFGLTVWVPNDPA